MQEPGSYESQPEGSADKQKRKNGQTSRIRCERSQVDRTEEKQAPENNLASRVDSIEEVHALVDDLIKENDLFTVEGIEEKKHMGQLVLLAGGID